MVRNGMNGMVGYGTTGMVQVGNANDGVEAGAASRSLTQREVCLTRKERQCLGEAMKVGILLAVCTLLLLLLLLLHHLLLPLRY